MKRLSLVAILIALLMALNIIFPAVAHEGREVGEGEDEVILNIGWRVEPAYTGLFNGPEIHIVNFEEQPIEGLESALTLEISYGGQTKALRLRAVADEPGNYTADLIPTQPGDYSYHLTGTIGNVEVDETFDSADGEFSSVNPIGDIQFP